MAEQPRVSRLCGAARRTSRHLSGFEEAHREAITRNDAHAAAAASAGSSLLAGASAEVVRSSVEADTASFGTTVTLRRDDGREQTFRIVGEDEADPSRGTVSYVSPVARAVTDVQARRYGRDSGR